MAKLFKLLATVGTVAVLFLLLPDHARSDSNRKLLYPERGEGGFSIAITRTLVRKRIRGCGEYSFKRAGSGEYHIACWSQAGKPTYYIVFTINNRVMTGLVLPRIMDSFVEGARLHVELDQWDGSFRGSGGGKLGEYQRGLSEFELTGTLIISNSGDRSAHLQSVGLVLRVADGPRSLLIDGKAAPLPFTKTIGGELTKTMEIAPGGIYFAEFRVYDALRAFYPLTDEEYKAGKWYPLDFTGTQIVAELVRHDLSREEISLPLDFGWKQ